MTYDKEQIISDEARLLACLSELGIATETVRHPPVFTVAELHLHCGHLEGLHAKNLFLKDARGELYLVSARDDASRRRASPGDTPSIEASRRCAQSDQPDT
jgi:hypothetical protein